MKYSVENFGKNLKMALVEKGMKQCQLADAIGVSYHTVSHFARGQKKPGLETLIKIANALGVTVDSLIK